MANFQPVDPVALGLCKQVELDAMVAKSSKKLDQAQSSKNDDSETTIVSTESSLIAADSKVPSNIAGLEGFSLTEIKSEEQGSIDPDSIFSLPKNDKE
tara:strand:- start:503 stop:796 length:294 start_codon:yes stop_codon:yes gene_type:complete